MRHINDDIIAKYHVEIEILKTELKGIYKFDSLPERRNQFSDLDDQEYEMLVKGYRNRKVEIEVTIHQRYAQIGRLAVKKES